MVVASVQPLTKCTVQSMCAKRQGVDQLAGPSIVASSWHRGIVVASWHRRQHVQVSLPRSCLHVAQVLTP